MAAASGLLLLDLHPRSLTCSSLSTRLWLRRRQLTRRPNSRVHVWGDCAPRFSSELGLGRQSSTALDADAQAACPRSVVCLARALAVLPCIVVESMCSWMGRAWHGRHGRCKVHVQPIRLEGRGSRCCCAEGPCSDRCDPQAVLDWCIQLSLACCDSKPDVQVVVAVSREWQRECCQSSSGTHR